MRISGLYCHQAKLVLLSREKKSISLLFILAPSATASFFYSLQRIPVSSEHLSLISSLHMLTSPSLLSQHNRHDSAAPSPEGMGKVCTVGYPSEIQETCITAKLSRWQPAEWLTMGMPFVLPQFPYQHNTTNAVDFFSIIFDLLSINSTWLQWQWWLPQKVKDRQYVPQSTMPSPCVMASARNLTSTWCNCWELVLGHGHPFPKAKWITQCCLRKITLSRCSHHLICLFRCHKKTSPHTASINNQYCASCGLSRWIHAEIQRLKHRLLLWQRGRWEEEVTLINLWSLIMFLNLANNDNDMGNQLSYSRV